ncbi:hypothetical protein KM043_012774 [Ampulex compressa]|nr:hypothetical protein KM043_012774 [Ampulex compressa]
MPPHSPWTFIPRFVPPPSSFLDLSLRQPSTKHPRHGWEVNDWPRAWPIIATAGGATETDTYPRIWRKALAECSIVFQPALRRLPLAAREAVGQILRSSTPGH